MPMHFHTGEVGEANDLVRKFHYSARPPANIIVVGSWHVDGGLFGDAGPMVAACYFSIPPTRWSEPVLELTRLVRAPHCTEPLSGLVSSTVHHIRRRFPQWPLLVSFADASVGHHGGIYQACSWNYAGQRARRMDGVVVNGAFIPGRTCNSLYGTQSPDRLRERGIPAEPHYDDGKHLYWRATSKAGRHVASRLGLHAKPYPKPELAAA